MQLLYSCEVLDPAAGARTVFRMRSPTRNCRLLSYQPIRALVGQKRVYHEQGVSSVVSGRMSISLNSLLAIESNALWVSRLSLSPKKCRQCVCVCGLCMCL